MVDPEAAFDAIAPLLGATERRVFGAAGRALVELGNPRGVEALSAFIAQSQDDTDRESAIDWLEQLTSKLDAGQ